MEPVAAEAIMRAVISGALVVLAGSFYALFFGLARYSGKSWLLLPAYLSYAGLVGAVVVLSAALNLTGYWLWLVFTMLVGYLLAPHAIWRLCVGTHGTDDASADEKEKQVTPSTI